MFNLFGKRFLFNFFLWYNIWVCWRLFFSYFFFFNFYFLCRFLVFVSCQYFWHLFLLLPFSSFLLISFCSKYLFLQVQFDDINYSHLGSLSTTLYIYWFSCFLNTTRSISPFSCSCTSYSTRYRWHNALIIISRGLFSFSNA